MQTIENLFGFDNPPEGTFGIEIETEGENLAMVVPHQWLIHDDGSLRGRFPNEKAEYVLAAPLNLQAAVKAVKDLAKAQAGATLNFSFRTSVHVHYNVCKFTEDQVLNLIYTYYLLEIPIMNLCGEHRIGNRFCLRLKDCDGIAAILTDIVRNSVKRIRQYGADAVRYAALNLDALSKFGSVEFRGMQGTLDTNTLTGWLGLISTLGAYAKSKQNIVEIHNSFIGQPTEKFVREVVGEGFYELLFYSGMHQDVELGHSLTLDLPHLYHRVKG